MAKRKSLIKILRARERKRRAVPAVVIRRRVALASQPDDPGADLLASASRLSRKHSRQLKSLMLRTMGLVQSPKATAAFFAAHGLDALSLDQSAVALINNSVRKISEILIFKLVATELVNDKALRDTMVLMFLNQRFEGMRQLPVVQPTTKPKSNTKDIVNETEAALTTLLNRLMDT